MTIKVKNWKLAVLAFLFFSFFMSLGVWQLNRAEQKKILLRSFIKRTEHAPFTAADLKQPNDLRFYRIQLEGRFDNQHTLLLDNKIFHGNVGYEVYTPFKVKGMEKPILVDRGFIPMGISRKELPAIREIPGSVTILGMLNMPPAYVAFGQINESNKITWPLRIEFVNTSALTQFLKYPLFPSILMLEPHDPATYSIEWQITTMGPEKHMGYAVQWFALALTLLILFVALNVNK